MENGGEFFREREQAAVGLRRRRTGWLRRASIQLTDREVVAWGAPGGSLAVGPQQLLAILWRNVATRDWPVAINGQRHEHVKTEVVETLVECELIVAETSWINEPDHGLALGALGRDKY